MYPDMGSALKLGPERFVTFFAFEWLEPTVNPKMCFEISFLSKSFAACLANKRFLATVR